MKKIFILFAIVGGIGALALVALAPSKKATPSHTVSSDAENRNQPVVAHQHHSTSRVPDHYTTTPRAGELKPTLAPELFDGNIRLAYQAARDIPETLAQIPCYCHCDMSKGHRSLHSCFVDEHGENCGICIGEAVMAHNLNRQGLSAAQIREQIVKAYGKDMED